MSYMNIKRYLLAIFVLSVVQGMSAMPSMLHDLWSKTVVLAGTCVKGTTTGINYVLANKADTLIRVGSTFCSHIKNHALEYSGFSVAMIVLGIHIVRSNKFKTQLNKIEEENKNLTFQLSIKQKKLEDKQKMSKKQESTMKALPSTFDEQKSHLEQHHQCSEFFQGFQCGNLPSSLSEKTCQALHNKYGL